MSQSTWKRIKEMAGHCENMVQLWIWLVCFNLLINDYIHLYLTILMIDHSELIVNGYLTETFGRIGHRLSLFNERKFFHLDINGNSAIGLN